MHAITITITIKMALIDFQVFYTKDYDILFFTFVTLFILTVNGGLSLRLLKI